MTKDTETYYPKGLVYDSEEYALIMSRAKVLRSQEIAQGLQQLSAFGQHWLRASCVRMGAPLVLRKH